MRTFIHAALVGATAFIFDATTASADMSDAQIARQKINLSGRQRMLSQRMSGAACIAMTGMGNGSFGQVAQKSHDDFAVALNGLRDGDQSLGLPVETDQSVRDAFDTVAGIWASMSPSVEQLAAGSHDSSMLSVIIEKNGELLRTSNAAVQAIVAAYGGSDIAADIAKAIDVAGRQRMLSQRMVKAACFLFVGLDSTSKDELMAAIELFDKSLSDLRNGNAAEGIAAPPTQLVSEQLESVADLWGAYRAQLEALASGEKAGPEDMLAIAVAGDEVLAQSHQAVLRYVDMAIAKTDG